MHGAAMPSLPVRLADRAVRQTNPVLAALSDLLDLTPARVTASELVDFAGLEPVRRRFHLDDDDLARVEEWIGSAGIRWGLDAAHRAPFQLDAVGANTWRAGLDRVLLGVSMTEDDQPLVGDVLPARRRRQRRHRAGRTPRRARRPGPRRDRRPDAAPVGAVLGGRDRRPPPTP